MASDVSETELRADRYLGSPAVVSLSPVVTGMRYSTPELLKIEAGLIDERATPPKRRGRCRRSRRGQRIHFEEAVVERRATRAGATRHRRQVRASILWSAPRARARRSRSTRHETPGNNQAIASSVSRSPLVRPPSFKPARAFRRSRSTRCCITANRTGIARCPTNAVVVVDEAGMVGTRKLDRLHRLTRRANAKLVLVGDPRQLPGDPGRRRLRRPVAPYRRDATRGEHAATRPRRTSRAARATRTESRRGDRTAH